MARALSYSPLLKTVLSDGISFLAKRRGYASVVETAKQSPKTEEMEAASKSVAGQRVADADPVPWVPDQNGYYRPANRLVEVDPAELRAKLLKPTNLVMSRGQEQFQCGCSMMRDQQHAQET